MKYIEDYYPDSKLLGTLSKIWGVRSFHISDLDYNFQYYLYSMEAARKNNDQPITTSKDSLTKFNANIAGRYKAGIGLNYLDDYTEDIDLRDLINIELFNGMYKGWISLEASLGNIRSKLFRMGCVNEEKVSATGQIFAHIDIGRDELDRFIGINGFALCNEKDILLDN